MSPGPAPRLNQLDGLRGVAALSVVVYHFVCAFVPSVTDPGATALNGPGEVVLRFLFSGSFAVAIFFVLSGFVIANSAAGRRQPFLVSASIRYLRLALPAAASVLLAWLLLRAMPDAVRQLDAISPSWWFKWTYQDPIPGLPTALRDGLLDNFLTGGSQFNNVLWTMRIELIGSLLLYAIFAVSRGGRVSWCLLARARSSSCCNAITTALSSSARSCAKLGRPGSCPAFQPGDCSGPAWCWAAAPRSSRCRAVLHSRKPRP